MSTIWSKWSREYILVVDGGEDESDKEKNVIYRSAQAYANLKQIPRQRMFTNEFWDSEWKKDFSEATEGCLQEVTADDKLFIFAHGDTKQVGAESPTKLAMLLNRCKLRRVGIITFKSCSVGEGDYLKILLSKLETLSIRVGILKAYRGAAITMKSTRDREGVRHGEIVRVYEKILDDFDDEIEGMDRCRFVFSSHFESMHRRSTNFQEWLDEKSKRYGL